jgi:hypothetical protein
LFDMFTVGLLAEAACAIGCLIVFITWMRDRSTRSYSWWILGFLLSGLGVILATQRQTLPQLSAMGVPGFFALFGAGALWSGLRVFDQRPLPVLALLPPLIWALGLPLAYPSFALRQVDYALAIGTMTLLIGLGSLALISQGTFAAPLHRADLPV